MELSFEYHCMNCLRIILPNNGVVLSCGDFFCSLCSQDIKNICPSCGIKEIRIMEIKNASKDVLDMFINPSQELQTLFDTLKFQITHYKTLLLKATKILNHVEYDRQQLIKKCTLLSEEIQYIKQQMKDSDSRLPEESSQNKIYWRSGVDRNDKIYFQPQDQTISSTSSTPKSISTPIVLNQDPNNIIPNKGFSNRLQSPNSPALHHSYKKRKNEIIEPIGLSSPSIYSQISGIDSKERKQLTSPLRPSTVPNSTQRTRLRSPYLPYVRSSGKVSIEPNSQTKY